MGQEWKSPAECGIVLSATAVPHSEMPPGSPELPKHAPMSLMGTEGGRVVTQELGRES